MRPRDRLDPDTLPVGLGSSAGALHKATVRLAVLVEKLLALREAGGILAIPSDSLPIRQGRHHGYHDSDPAFREKQSKKTYDRLLHRFRGKDHLLAPR